MYTISSRMLRSVVLSGRVAARMTLGGVLCFVCLILPPMLLPALADPDITSDFLIPDGVNASSLDGSFFTSTTLREVQTSSGADAIVIPVNSHQFPALDGQGISFAMLHLPPRSLNALHIHPRGSELLFVMEGALFVGLVDSTSKLYTQTLHPGDLFLFPKGLVHFQINWDMTQTVKAVAGFGSSNPGLIRLENNVFRSDISDAVLRRSFGVSAEVLRDLRTVHL